MNCSARKTELENPSFPSTFMLLAVIKCVRGAFVKFVK